MNKEICFKEKKERKLIMKKKIARFTIFIMALAVCLPVIGINAGHLYSYDGWDISGGLATADFTTSKKTVKTDTSFKRTYVKPGYSNAPFTLVLRKRNWIGTYEKKDEISFKNGWSGTVTFTSSGTGIHDLYFHSSNYNFWSCKGTVYE